MLFWSTEGVALGAERGIVLGAHRGAVLGAQRGAVLGAERFVGTSEAKGKGRVMKLIAHCYNVHYDVSWLGNGGL